MSARCGKISDVAGSRVLLAVDGNSLLHRSYHAQARTGLRSAEGRPMWAVRGLLSALVLAAERVCPDIIVVGFDDPDTSVRREMWPHYKANRVDKLETRVAQLAFAVEVLRDMGVAVVTPAGLEADDVVASAARFASAAGATTVVMTSDRDAFTLIDEQTTVLRIIDGGVEASPMMTPSRLVTLLGVRPDQYLDYAALRGDASDNLPGVRGIGAKTAAALLAELGSARAAFDDLDADGDRVASAIGASRARLLSEPAARAAWELNCEVMALHSDLALGIDFDGGAGCLPLVADVVRETFLGQQLTWTTAAALRVLAGQQPGESSPTAPAPAAQPDEPNWQWTGGRRRFGRLVVDQPKVEQLALF
jgi:5'-3' exonuclease